MVFPKNIRSPAPFFTFAALLAALLVPLFSAGCPTYATIPVADRDHINQDHDGRLLYLKQSLYVGDFYDDDRYRLLHPRRFEELTYLRTVEGEVIMPPPAKGIIPVGTRVRVEKIEWATGDAVFKRPLYTPRYTTWVWLRVAQDRGPTRLERKERHILLLPGGIKDRETFDNWFYASLTREDPNAWLMGLPHEVRKGVFDKKAVEGMDYDTLTAAMGFPDRLARQEAEGDKSGATLEVAHYGPLEVELLNGRVKSVK
jgi:hypothetical protein